MSGNTRFFCAIQKTIFPVFFNKHFLFAIPGIVYFFYILFPVRFWEPFVFSNQTEQVVIAVFFAGVLLLFLLPKIYQTKTFHLNKIDLVFIIYSIYILFRFKYPLEKEYLFIAFSLVCIYLYFRNFPDYYLEGLLFLLPVTGIIQIIDGVNRFTMPWHNLSHITGIFNNTGLFGGYAALGFVVCTGMIFFYIIFHKGAKFTKSLSAFYLLRHFKSIVFIVLGIVLALQVYFSGSRASWVAASGAIFFLLYRYIPKCRITLFRIRNPQQSGNITTSLRGGTTKQSMMIRIFLIASFLLLLFFSSKYLYHLKKDSADGRLLIAKVSVAMVEEAPLFGSGITGFRTGYLPHQATYFQAHPDSPYLMIADDVETPFNEFLKILIEQGVLGLLLVDYLIYCLFEKEIPVNSQHYGRLTITQSMILYILIFGLFSYPFDKLPFLVLFVFLCAILSHNRHPVFSIRLKKMNFVRIPILIAFCLVSLAIAWNAFSYSQSCRKWNQALAHFASGKEKSLSQLKKLYPGLENNPVFLTTYGKALSFGEQYQEAAFILEKAVERQPLSTSYIELGKCYEATGLSEKAFACWKHAGLTVPARFAPEYLIIKLLFETGKIAEALEKATVFLKKEKKIDNPAIYEMQEEIKTLIITHSQ